MDSSSRRARLHALTVLVVTFVCIHAILPVSAQGSASTPAPSPTSAQPQTAPASPQPSVVDPTPVSQPTAGTPISTPTAVGTPIPHSTIVPTSPSAPDPLSLQMDLGDGKRLWHPTRREMGIVETLNYSPSNPHFAVKINALTAYLKKLAPYVRRSPIKAKINLNSSSDWTGLSDVHSSVPVLLHVSPGQSGAVLDIDSSITQIAKSIFLYPTQTHIILALHTSAAPPEDKVFDTVSARLSHYVTHFNPGEAGRTQTVRRAISLVNGTVVQPGQIFSLNESVGERTAARGFGMGIVFVDGHLDKQLGGGMCQVATTLYNAVLLAHLKVVERHAHARTVPYVEPGQDATVYWGSKDFKFQNDSGSPVYISYRTTETHAVCDLYGKYVAGLKVRTVDDYQRLGQRHYSATLRRFSTIKGKTVVDYESYSDYNWTPSLDYTF